LNIKWHPTLNGDRKPSDYKAGSNKRAHWVCDKGHPFEAVIASVALQGTGCPVCSGRLILQGVNDLVTVNPELASEWDYAKNTENPNKISPNSHKKAQWVCSICKNSWEAQIKSRNLGGAGCKCTARQKQAKNYRQNRIKKVGSLADTNPVLASEWHSTKNGTLTPADVSAGCPDKAWWFCSTCCNEWYATIASRNAGNGCKVCGFKQSAKTRVLQAIQKGGSLADNNPILASEWHPTKNKSLTPHDFLAGSNDRAYWLCPVCEHEWNAVISSRNSGVGCPECGKLKGAKSRIENAIKKRGSLLSNNPKLASEWHPTKNGDLKPADVLANSNELRWWQCNKGHEWQATVASRNTGHGCRKCSSETQSSFPEQAIFYYLNKQVHCESRLKVFGSEIDIFIPSLRVGIEYDGKYYHTSDSSQMRKDKKQLLMIENDITLYHVIEGDKYRADKGSRTIYCKFDNKYLYLEQVINTLSKWVLGYGIKADMASESTKIYAQYAQAKKANSIAEKCSDSLSFWDYEENAPLLPDQVSYGRDKKVSWKCKHGHKWKTSPWEFYSGKRCPFCSGRIAIEGENDLATTHPNLV
jgi:DNA-directed RNA polymerase subunit RPC12/RpoP